MPVSAEREKQVRFRKEGLQTQLAEYIKTHCQELGRGSGIFYDPEGNIFYQTWRDLPRTGLLPPEYVQISRTPAQADIYAPHTRYVGRKGHIFKQIKKDEGSVEAAIRAMDHVLVGQRREAKQVRAIAGRSREVLDLFGTDFSKLTPAEFARQRDKTYARLRRVKLDPQRVYNQEKQRMARWLIKGSFGHDTLGHENALIATGALEAASRAAFRKMKGIGEIEVKFLERRARFVFERRLYRAVFADVAQEMQRMPLHSLFAKPDSPVTNLGPVLGRLRTMRYQLDRVLLKPYRPAAQTGLKLLEEIEQLLLQGFQGRAEIKQRRLFAAVGNILITEDFKRRARIYEEEKLKKE